MVLVGLRRFGELGESEGSSEPSGRRRPRPLEPASWAPPSANVKSEPTAAAAEIHSRRRLEGCIHTSETRRDERVPRTTQCYTLAPREYDVQSLREFARLHDTKRAACGVYFGARAGVQPLAASGHGPAGATGGIAGARGASARTANASARGRGV